MALLSRTSVKLTSGQSNELMPGDVALGRSGDAMKTLLGSCIAVILTDPRRTVGAMCHIVHVGFQNAATAGNTAYGLSAMREMFDLLTAEGVMPSLCHAYVYGGGNMFPHLYTTRTVGDRNAEWVLEFLQQQGITVVQSSVGGPNYRKVSWTIGPGAPDIETVLVTEGA